jgi:glyoxylase-like metal-dependent hydrolase (beta-lactamase superfamily II)
MFVGGVEVLPILDGYGLLDPTQFFAGTTAEQWQNHSEYLRQDGMWRFPVGGFLVRTSDRTVLIDAGYGPNNTSSMSDGGSLLRNLAAVGVATTDVTDVVFTHLHPDHIGWAVSEGKLTFENATHRCHAADWTYFTEGNGAAMLKRPLEGMAGSYTGGLQWIDVVFAMQDRLETWGNDGVLLPNIDVIMAPGHTPGSTIAVISSGPERAVVVGDAIHCPAQLTETDWGCIGDVDPVSAARIRAQLVAELEGSNTLVAGPHFPEMRFGRVLVADRGSRWSFPQTPGSDKIG